MFDLDHLADLDRALRALSASIPVHLAIPQADASTAHRGAHPAHSVSTADAA